MKDGDLVSVVVSVYNYGRFLDDCLVSVLGQTYKNVEIIVVDDASTDSSLSIARKYEGSRVKVIHFSKNKGCAKAKNEGIINSQGEAIVVCDADDMLPKKCITSRVRVMVDKNIPFVHGALMNISVDTSLIDAHGQMRSLTDKQKRGLYAKSRRHIGQGDGLIARHVFTRYGLFDENLKSFVDVEMHRRFFGRLPGLRPLERIFVREIVYFRRRHRLRMSKMRKANPSYNRTERRKMIRGLTRRRNKGLSSSNTRFLLR